jgi:hypothetical protein
MSIRIYAVKDGDTTRLVRASHPSVAISHVARGKFKAAVAKPEEIVTAMTNGVKVEDASAEPAGDAGGDAQ